MQPFVTSQIKDQISEITFGTPKSNSLPSEILEILAVCSGGIIFFAGVV